MPRLLAFLLIFPAMLVTASCFDQSITGFRPLSFEVSVTPETTTINASVDVNFSATGTQIRVIIIDFGDGVSDTLAYLNPVEVSDRTSHAYSATGVYTVSGRLVSGSGNRTAEAQVTVN
jgi:PKD repeat protein